MEKQMRTRRARIVAMPLALLFAAAAVVVAAWVDDSEPTPGETPGDTSGGHSVTGVVREVRVIRQLDPATGHTGDVELESLMVEIDGGDLVEVEIDDEAAQDLAGGGSEITIGGGDRVTVERAASGTPWKFASFAK